MTTPPPDVSDATIERYVLGELSAEDTERLDELSIVDAAFAERLQAIEADVADACARGELSRDARERWEALHLGSAHGRAELQLSYALADRERLHVTARSFPRWGAALAAAALVILIAGVLVLLLQRRTVNSSDIATTRPQAPAAASAQPGRPGPPTVVALTLAPSMRGATTWTTLRVPRNASIVRLRLLLEPNDYSFFDVTIRSARSGAPQWQAGHRQAETAGDERLVAIDVPANVFVQGRYVIETAGVRGTTSDVVGTYPLEAVLE